MKRIGVTQRVEVVADYGERRDCLDQKWCALLESAGFVATPIPNAFGPDDDVVGLFGLDGVILSGGNDPIAAPRAKNTAPERDATETALIAQSVARDQPVLGVCRGLMMINLHFGGALTRADGHRAVRHKVRVQSGDVIDWPQEIDVNSFHTLVIGAGDLASPLRPIAVAGDGTIEAVRHADRPCFGVMWHPEREVPFANRDVEMLKRIFRPEDS